MRFDILTLFPELFNPFLKEGVLGRAVQKGVINIKLINIRSFSRGKHNVTDDRPYGGGNGMVMKPGPIFRALKSVNRISARSLVVLLSPQGARFDQDMAWKLAEREQLILICGRYEGVDERIKTGHIDQEISIGDFILSGGELGALIVVDAISRLIPGVLGGERSNIEDTFSEGLLKYPQYTRPRIFQGEEVPEVLLSGNHERIRAWRKMESLKRTMEKRPDLLKKAHLSEADKELLAEMEME